jgi:hypothetical protein
MPLTTCLYCEEPVAGVSRGEHVVPDSIGGTLTILNVCRSCNNGVLSDIDKELVSRSPLAMIAAREIGNSIGLLFDVDHSENELLLDARLPTPSSSPTLYPQIVFEDSGPKIRGDLEELTPLGGDIFARSLLHAAKDRLISDASVSNPNRRRLVQRNLRFCPGPYRYPPRIIATRPISRFDDRMKMELRYISDSDRAFAVEQLEALDPDMSFGKAASQLGSPLPLVRSSFELVAAMRGVTKISLNMLEWIEQLVSSKRDQFLDTIQFVRFGTSHPIDRKQNGFVRAVTLALLECPANCHKFRFTFGAKESAWRVYAGFFGGKVGVTICIPGAAPKSWVTADVTVPINSPDWVVTRSPLMLPLLVEVNNDDISQIIPSAEILNPQTRTTETERPN